MGLISSIKGMFSDALVEEVVKAYGLKRSDQSYQLWTGFAFNHPFSLEQGYDKKSWIVTAGDLGPNADEEDSVFLERFDPSKPGNEMAHDEVIDGPLVQAGPAVVEQYLIGGEPESGDYSVLKHPAVGRTLPSFSSAVELVDLYFNRHVVVIYLKREGLDRQTFDRDLGLAVELSKALAG